MAVPSETQQVVDIAEPFGIFFQREFHRMVTLAQAVSGDPSAGEDIAAEAMLKASRRWEKVGTYDRPGAWVRRVTINLANNRRRRLRRERRMVAQQRVEVVASPDPPVDEDLWAAVVALPRQQRAATALRYLEDMGVAETAEILQCSESAVRSHLHKARATLGRVLGEGGRS